VQLDKTVIYNGLDTSDEFPVLTTTETWGTRAYASGTGGTWTRPPIALNQRRAYDPLLGAFLQADPADIDARLVPEGYAYARHNSVMGLDRSGERVDGRSIGSGSAILNFGENSGCTANDQRTLENAAALAWKTITECYSGYCGGAGAGKRRWLAALSSGTTYCRRDFAYEGPGQPKGAPLLGGLKSLGPGLWSTATNSPDGREVYYYGRTIDSYWTPGEGPQCLAAMIAHERLHPRNPFRMRDPADYTWNARAQGVRSMPFYSVDRLEEDFVDEAVDAIGGRGCFRCAGIAGLNVGFSGQPSGLLPR
jgi:hypothetical protein